MDKEPFYLTKSGDFSGWSSERISFVMIQRIMFSLKTVIKWYFKL